MSTNTKHFFLSVLILCLLPPSAAPPPPPALNYTSEFAKRSARSDTGNIYKLLLWLSATGGEAKRRRSGALTYVRRGECIFRAKTARLLPAIFHRPLKPAGFGDAPGTVCRFSLAAACIKGRAIVKCNYV